VKSHDAHLEELVGQCVPAMVEARGIGTGTAAEMLALAGDDAERIRSEAAFAELCGACSIHVSSGKTGRHRLNHSGHRQANAALHRVVVVQMRTHRPTVDHVRPVPPRERASERSSAAPSASSPARSSAISAIALRPPD
jgi:transposase